MLQVVPQSHHVPHSLAPPQQAAPCGAARSGQDSESFNITKEQQTDNAKLLGSVSALFHRGVVMGDDAAQQELQALVKEQQDKVLASSFIEQACFA